MKTLKKFCLFLAVALLLLGCGNSEEKEEVKSGYQIYYLNSEGTAIIPKSYVPNGSDTEQMVEEFLEVLGKQPNSLEYKRSKPEDVTLQDYYIEDKQLNLKFDLPYNAMPDTTEVLMRAAYVKTLVQIPDIDLVVFFVGDQPLMDSKGEAIGAMNQESFVENSAGDVNVYQETTLILYFANKNGDKLVQTTKNLVYNSNISMERLIMEQLIKGPSEDNKEVAPSVSTTTKLLGISVKDSICYVNLSEGFLKATTEVTEEVQIYSIVNSLAELPTVSKVQISINGVTDRVFLDKIKFSTIFERDLDIIQTKN